jgi:hypothetical protein
MGIRNDRFQCFVLLNVTYAGQSFPQSAEQKNTFLVSHNMNSQAE